MKNIIRIFKNINNRCLKSCLVLALIFIANGLFAQGTHPGEDPFQTPIDGGILMALLTVGGLITMLFKKKKDKE